MKAFKTVLKKQGAVLLLCLFSLVIQSSFCQTKPVLVILKYKNRKLCFDSVFQKNRLIRKSQVQQAAHNWLTETFPGTTVKSIYDQQHNSINMGDARMKILTGNNADYYWLRFHYNLAAKDSTYSFSITDIYEKPIEKGITNDYSKLEYRYWDYSHLKPWTKDDQPVFQGLQLEVNRLESSLKASIESVKIEKPLFSVLALYSKNVEDDHVDFANTAIHFFSALADQRNFSFDTSSNWKKLTEPALKNYQLVIWLDDFPQSAVQRSGFENYMEHGGAWLGFHVSAYNDKDTKWPWFVQFLGGAVFFDNNWPPLPAKMIVDDNHHPVTRHMPNKFIASINEWYGWKPNPRTNKNVKVLVTLDPANFPLGKKDRIINEDMPVVWTNTRYKMLYMNMGHGDQNFNSSIENKLYEDAVIWLGTPKTNNNRKQ